MSVSNQLWAKMFQRRFIKWIFGRFLYSFSLTLCRYPFNLIKIYSPQGWLTTFTCIEGLSYVLGRPGDKKVIDSLLLKPGWIAIDAGANIGWYTIIMSKMVGNTGKVIAFEPEPLNFRILSKNIKDHNLKNVVTFQIALSNIDGHAELQLSKNPATPSIMARGSNSITVETMRLDTILRKLGVSNVDFMKIDVEGAEMNLLKGSTETIKTKPTIIMETWSSKTKSQKVMKSWREGDAEDFLRGANYEVTWIDERNIFARPKTKTHD